MWDPALRSRSTQRTDPKTYGAGTQPGPDRQGVGHIAAPPSRGAPPAARPSCKQGKLPGITVPMQLRRANEAPPRLVTPCVRCAVLVY
jgi:hypothetical protein